MSFLYDRVVSVTRDGVTIASGVDASIQLKRPPRYEDMSRGSSTFFHDEWIVLPEPSADVTFQVRDLVTDDTGDAYRVASVDPTPMGPQLTAVWADWTNDTVFIAPSLSVDDRGQDVYGAPVSYACRIIQAARIILQPDGEQAVSTAVIYFDGAAPAGLRDQITLPADQGTGTQRRILDIANVPDQFGNPYGAIWVM